MYRGQVLAALRTTVIGAIDIGATVGALCWHGDAPSFDNFALQFGEFSLLNSTIDLLLVALLRLALISLGCALLLLKSDPIPILQKLSHLSFSIVILMAAYSPTKLLLLAEKKDTLFVGDWIVLVENFIAAIIAHKLWLSFITTAETQAAAQQQENSSDSENEDEEEVVDPQVPKQETFEVVVRLMQYCRREWLWHLSGFTWLFVYSITRIFVPLYTGRVIASVVDAAGDPAKAHAALFESGKLMIVISVVSAAAGGFRGGSFEYCYSRIQRAIRHDLFTSLIKQDVAFFDLHKTGEITSRLTADTQTMSDTVALNVNVFLRNIVQMGGSMLVMLGLCWRLSLVPFIVVPIILVASKIFGVYYDYLAEKTQNAVAHSNDVAEEVLSTMRTVRSFACEQVEAERFYSKLTDTLNVTRQKAFAYVGYLWVSELFQTVINVAVLWYGGHLVLTNKLNKDLLVSFLLYQMQLADNIRQLGEVWTGLMQSVGAARKVCEYIDRKPNLDITGEHIPEKISGKIEFKNVKFAYPTRPNNIIMQNLSFTVEPGEVVALVGPSGSGKSSCIGLLEHFYEPLDGEVLIDGVPIEQYEHHFIHNAISLVGQEPVLFARSVEQNIGYGIDNCPKADVIEAAKLANAHSFIENTHEQYDTDVGEKGSQMSGGQKQRIAIARSLVRKPAILLLDEATSALDTESEHLVQEAIYNNLKGRTVILIAHRLSTVEKANKIIVINKGVVEQMGTHEQLLQQEGMYRTLVQRQMIGTGNKSVPTVHGPGSEAGESSLTPRRPFTRTGPGSTLSASPPQTMAQSLLGTSFTPSTTSFQSK
uniref:ABC-type antigen peptide transporter n=1 Tax=Panagrellus redivivus TaxID=6233 RepID=A0A7E4ZYN6_PANRE